MTVNILFLSLDCFFQISYNVLYFQEWVDSMKLSLIVPCYNEAENVANFQAAVISAFDGCGYDYEIVFIDDGNKVLC